MSLCFLEYPPQVGGDAPTGSHILKEVRAEWKQMWNESFLDRWKAETVAVKDYPRLFVERGTVILAAKDCKVPVLEEIIQLHEAVVGGRIIRPTNPYEGGWGKFIRDVIMKLPHAQFQAKSGRSCPLKKGGRGLLHQFPSKKFKPTF